jgi:hypothetical protein
MVKLPALLPSPVRLRFPHGHAGVATQFCLMVGVS